jgi:hypothetical protein
VREITSARGAGFRSLLRCATTWGGGVGTYNFGFRIADFGMFIGCLGSCGEVIMRVVLEALAASLSTKIVPQGDRKAFAISN